MSSLNSSNSMDKVYVNKDKTRVVLTINKVCLRKCMIFIYPTPKSGRNHSYILFSFNVFYNQLHVLKGLHLVTSISMAVCVSCCIDKHILLLHYLHISGGNIIDIPYVIISILIYMFFAKWLESK